MQINQFQHLVAERNSLVAEAAKALADPAVDTDEGWAAYTAAADRKSAVEQKLMAMQPRSVADLAVIAAIVGDYQRLEQPSAANERVSQLLTAIETLSEYAQ